MEISSLRLLLLLITVWFLTLLFSNQMKRTLIYYIPSSKNIFGHEFIVQPVIDNTISA